MPKWVRSKYSEMAKKWEVCEENKQFYTADMGWHQTLYLPKCDYIECEPPEHWEVCTREVVGIDEKDYGKALLQKGRSISMFGQVAALGLLATGFRWAWSEKDINALVIERKVKE